VEKFRPHFRKVKSGASLPISLVRVVWEFRKKKVIYFVCSPCLTISPWLKLFGRKGIFLDAGWPLSDNTHKGNFHILNLVKNLRIHTIERIAFKVSNLIFLESKVQASRVSLTFKMDPRKLVVGYTGVNESEFEVEPVKPPELLQISELSKRTTILFRGKINEEAGLERIQELFSNLEDATFIMCSSNLTASFPEYKNVITITRNVSFAEMKYLYEISDLTIGQLGSSTRQARTIPHKAFESAYFGKPYLGVNQEALYELFYEEESSLLFSNFEELLSGLKKFLRNGESLNKIGLKAKHIYNKDFNQELLSQKRIDQIIKYSYES
jgi:hypothetical protein